MTYLSNQGGMGMVYQGNSMLQSHQPIYSLEAVALQEYAPHIPAQHSAFSQAPLRFYGASPEYHNKSYAPNYASVPHIDAFSPEPFLNPTRPLARFVGETVEIAEYIEQTFEATTGKRLPGDVSIQVLPTEEFKAMHEQFGGFWSEGLQGFSINNKGFGQSLVFVRQGSLDRVMITAGHELGHVHSFSLRKKHDEEAKAFAFEMAWIRALHDEDIAHLRTSINLNPMLPARNGLHDVAFDFVQQQMRQGKEGLLIFSQLVQQEVTVHDLLWN